MAIKQITSVPSISPEGKSIAKIREVRGKSLAWNQLMKPNRYVVGSRVTVSCTEDFVITVTSTSDSTDAKYARAAEFSPQSGHKYYIAATVDATHLTSGVGTIQMRISTNGNEISVGKNAGTKGRVSAIGSVTSALDFVLRVSDTTPSGEYATFKDIIGIDLTLMFGAGNEPETVEEFEAMFPENYYKYNSGEIINSNINTIETVEFNQWDEEWEGGFWNANTGEAGESSNWSRNKNPIRCLPNTSYCFKFANSNGNLGYILFYDAAGVFISSIAMVSGVNGASGANGQVFTTPDRAGQIRFYAAAAYSTVKTIINISDTSRNGTYEPYKKSTLPLNISTLTGKLNGEGESVVICSDGLKSAGSVYDYGIIENGYLTKIVKCVGMADLGELTYNKDSGYNNVFFGILPINARYRGTGSDTTTNASISGRYTLRPYYDIAREVDKTYNVGVYLASGGAFNTARIWIVDATYTTAADLKASLNGVKIVFELATPEEYVLDTPILMEYNTDGGTEQIVFSENLLSTPLVANIDYFNNAIKHIQFNEEKHCIRDERITGIDYIPIEHSTNVVTSAGVYNAISEAKAPLQSVSYKSAWLSTSAHTVHFLMNVKPVDWEKVYTVKYRLNCSIEDTASSNTESLVTLQFTKDALRAYYVENAVTNTARKSFYQHYVYPVSSVGFNSGFGAGVGIYIHQSTASYSYAGSSRYRLIDIDLLEIINCEVELFSEDLDAEDMQLNTSTTHMAGVAISSATGLQETGDANNTYANYSFGNSYGICTTAEGTLAKTSAISNYSLTQGAVTTIYFENAVPAGSTLNVNVIGAKPIYYKNEPIVDNIIKAGDTATFRYTSDVLSSGAYMLVALDRDFNDFIVAKALNDLESTKEDLENKVTSLTPFSTDIQYPSAKAVYDHINTQLTSVLKYKGTIGTGGTVTTLPDSHNIGDVYVVSTAGTYAGKACEVGDYIICKTAGTSASDAHWDIVNGENQVENKSASLASAGSSATIATVDGTNITVTTPSSWIVTDTKNTAGSTDTSNKIFLIGATSQDTNPQTYSDNEVYATSGVLTTKSVQVGGTSATMQYNSTDQSIEFVFS